MTLHAVKAVPLNTRREPNCGTKVCVITENRTFSSFGSPWNLLPQDIGLSPKSPLKAINTAHQLQDKPGTAGAGRETGLAMAEAPHGTG